MGGVQNGRNCEDFPECAAGGAVWRRYFGEGFVDAMVMVEGLKLVLAYGPKDHKGFDDVYPTVVKNGRPEMLTDRSAIRK